jgi:antitoxin YefM
MKEARMYSSYTLRADELTDGFLKGLKETYRNKEIEIVVQEVEDETAYLLSNEANRRHLERSKAAIESGKGLIEVTIENLESCV